MKNLFPERTNELNSYIAGIWETARIVLKWYRDNGQWSFFASQASAMKFLFPKRKDELGLDGEFWREMRQELANNREQKRWGDFTFLAKNMKRLALKVEETEEREEPKTETRAARILPFARPKR